MVLQAMRDPLPLLKAGFDSVTPEQYVMPGLDMPDISNCIIFNQKLVNYNSVHW